jgi:hypothetical protein
VKRSQAGGGVAVKIEHAVYQPAKMFGRHFQEADEIVSQISRESLDVLKVSRICFVSLALTKREPVAYAHVKSPAFKSDVSKEDVQLLVRLKAVLGIQ